MSSDTTPEPRPGRQPKDRTAKLPENYRISRRTWRGLQPPKPRDPTASGADARQIAAADKRERKRKANAAIIRHELKQMCAGRTKRDRSKGQNKKRGKGGGW